MTDVLKSGDRAKAGALVSAKGLVLEEVFLHLKNKKYCNFLPYNCVYVVVGFRFTMKS